jgi:spore maturation protein CgeB
LASNRHPIAVMATEFWSGSTGAGIAQGLRKLGWLVHEIDIRDYIGAPGKSILAKGLRRLQKSFTIDDYKQSIIESCDILRPDIFLTVKGVELTPELLNEVSSLGITTVNYYPDYHFEYKNFDKDTIPIYDCFISTKSFQIEWLRGQRNGGLTGFVSHGYCEDIHHPVYRKMDNSYLCDVGYAGNCSPYKAEILNTLLDRDPKLDLLVTGPNWDRANDYNRLCSKHDRRERRNIAFAEFLQRSRINLAFHYGRAANGWADLVSTRSFEIPACAGFMIHIDNDEIRSHYKAGEEIETFASSEELVDKIEFYLANPEVRERVAVKGYERAVPAYGYAERAREIVDFIGMGRASK